MEKVSTYTGVMFDKLDKLKSAAVNATVTAYCATKSAVGAVGALIGNPLTKDYEVGRHVASFGPNLAWKIFDGKKKTTGQEVSLVVFEKRLLDSVDKHDKQTVLDVMKKGAVQLTRLRHPRILMIQHPLEESKDCLAFATEPIFASLANVLGKHENMPSPPTPEFATFKMYDVERVYGLYQLVEGLTFLHNDAKILQGCLNPENIVVTKNGQWKISGLFFSSTTCVIDGQSTYSGCEWEPRLCPYAQPDLDYAAPEYILSKSCDVSCDMFSLGVLIFAIFNKGKTPYHCNNNMTAFKRNVEQMSRQSLSGLGDVPQELKPHVTSLLSMTSSLRPDVHQMAKISYFENVAALTLQYLDSLMQRDDMEKTQFFKSLYKIMSKLPKRVIMQRVLPQLCIQFSNHKLVPFVLPNVLLITEDATTEEFTKLILPDLKPVFKLQEPVQVILIFIKKLDLLLSKTPGDSIRDDILPMVFRALEAPSTEIQEMVLNVIPSIAQMVDYTLMKNSVISRIKSLCLQTSSLAVRVNSLVCIGKVLEHLDKYAVMEDILPFLAQIPSREAPTLMAILGIYKQTMVHKKLGMDKDYLALKAIPFLFPLSIEPSLNLQQFSQYMSILNDMVKQVQVEHKAKLEQLGKMHEQTQSSLKFAQEAQEAKAMDDLVSKIDKAFCEKPVYHTGDTRNSSGAAEFNNLFGLSADSDKKDSTLNDLGVFGVLSVPCSSSSSQKNISPQRSAKSSYSQASSAPLLASNTNSTSQSQPARQTMPVHPTRSGGMGTMSGVGSMGTGTMATMSGVGNMGTGTMGTMSGVGNMGTGTMGSMSTGIIGTMSTGMGSRQGANSSIQSNSITGTMPAHFTPGLYPSHANNMSSQGVGSSSAWSMNPTPTGRTAHNVCTVPSSGHVQWTPSCTSSRTNQVKPTNALDTLYSPEMSHLQNKNKLSLSSLQAQKTTAIAPTGNLVIGAMGVHPSSGAGVMMSPIQQQSIMATTRSSAQSGGGSTNDLKDIFG